MRYLRPGGAMETFLRARKQGKIRYIGFSAHSVEAALAMLDRFQFDSILFPVNFICYARGNFGPQVMAKAKEMGVARLAIKAMAHGPWRNAAISENIPNCWYRPIDDRDPGEAGAAFHSLGRRNGRHASRRRTPVPHGAGTRPRSPAAHRIRARDAPGQHEGAATINESIIRDSRFRIPDSD